MARALNLPLGDNLFGQRQKVVPPDILLTTPEQLALLLAAREAPSMFADLRCVVLDELHALAPSKRGDLLALDLARLTTLAPAHRRVGLSATVAFPDALARYVGAGTRIVQVKNGPKAGTGKRATA